MSWRIVVVSSSAKVDYKADYLVIRTLDSTKRIHMSEIGVVILESTAVSITAYALYLSVANRIMDQIRVNKPPSGIVQMLTVTEKQFSKMEFLVGESQSEIVDSDKRLIIM